MHYVHKKAIWGSEIATFRTKILHFFRVIRLNSLAKTELRKARSSSLHIVVSYCCKRKMLKRNWNWKKSRLFLAHFCHWWKFNWGVGSLVPLPLSLATPMLQLRKTKRCSQIFREVSGVSNKISTVQKIVLSSSRGQGNFQGLEASRPRPRASKCVLEDVLEAKDVLEDSTSGHNAFTFDHNNLFTAWS